MSRIRKTSLPLGVYSPNYIKKLVEFPCAPSPEIWVQTFLPAALQAIISLAPTDKKSLFKLAFGHSWVCGLKQIVTEAELIDPVASTATEAIFRFIEMSDALAWYVFLAEIGVEFVSKWHSMARRAAHCGSRGFARWSGAGLAMIGGDGTVWSRGNGATGTGDVTHLLTFRGVNIPAGSAASCGFSVTGQPNIFSVGDYSIKTGVMNYTTGEVSNVKESSPSGPPPHTHSIDPIDAFAVIDQEYGPVFSVIGPSSVVWEVTDGVAMIQLEN